MSLPLEGIRVLDLTGNLAGPFCTQILVDFGAEVIKVENIAGGDPSRVGHPRVGEEGANFFVVNRSKKSLALDIRSETGKNVFKRMAENSDVVVESFRPGVMKKMGLDYEVLCEINPRLIYCSMSGYGVESTRSQAASHDLNILSSSGVTSLIGSVKSPPQFSGAQFGGLAGGSLNAAIAILLAIIARGKTGQGQFCEIAMVDGALTLLCNMLGFRSGFGADVEWATRLFNGIGACYNIYQTKDGDYVSLAAIEPKFWRAFCEKIGRPEYVEKQFDPQIQQEMKSEVSDLMKTKTKSEWVREFADTDLCFSPVLTLNEVCEEENFLNREMILKLDNFRNSGKELVVTGQPIRLSGTPADVKLEFPRFGQHSREVLAETGFTEEEITKLAKQNIIA